MTAKIADFQTRILGADGVCDPHEVEAVDARFKVVFRGSSAAKSGTVPRGMNCRNTCRAPNHSWSAIACCTHGPSTGSALPTDEPFSPFHAR
jgi:hypothetical protein